MGDEWVGLVSPGEMGAAVAASLIRSGRRVLSVLEGRSAVTGRRAAAAGIEVVDHLSELVGRASVVLSVVPPGAAMAVATDLATEIRSSGSRPLVVEANAVSPDHAAAMSRLVQDAGAELVDADFIGGPPGLGRPPTRLYLSGPEAARAAAALGTPELTALVLPGSAVAASSLKMAYASWTKGSAALLLACRSLAAALGVESALLAEWDASLPDLRARCDGAARNAGRAWRFVAEMEEIAATYRASGLPDGFGEAAAQLYSRLVTLRGDAAPDPEQVRDLLLQGG